MCLLVLADVAALAVAHTTAVNVGIPPGHRTGETMRILRLALTAGLALVAGQARAGAPTDVPPDPKVVEFINGFCADMGAAAKEKAGMTDADISELGKKAMKYYHKSHFNGAKDNLKDDRLRFSFKKGIGNLKFYKCPVEITRVRKTNTSGIGFKDTAEKGQVFDYFLKKNDGVAGMPAQIRVFVNEKGEISFDDLGSL